MSQVIDCRGLACPEPIIRVKNELKEEKAEVLLSSVTARDNVIRTVEKMGWKVIVEKNEDGYKLLLQK